MSVECPTCGQEFGGDLGLKVHHTTAHGERLVEDETVACDYCGEEFTPSSGSTGRFCSSECFGAHRREGDTQQCAVCDEIFYVTPTERRRGRRYCSQECYGIARSTSETRECPMCGRPFTTKESAQKTHCCRACSAESRTSKPRPDDLRGLLWVLYVYEDRNFVQTYRRQRAIYGAEGALEQDEVREHLKEMGVYAPNDQLRRSLERADPDAIGDELPDGDDAWRTLYEEGSA